MKYSAIALLILVLSSCQIPKSDNEENLPTSKLEAITALAEIDTAKEGSESVTPKTNQNQETTLQVLLIARGSEPGWYAEFYADHLKLLIDNGTDSVVINDNFSDIDQKQEYHAFDKKSKKDVFVKLNNQPCTDASGEKREKNISITYNHKTYKGCATSKLN